RKGRIFERATGGVFWRVFNFFSETKVPLNAITERLMRRSYVSAVNTLGDKNLFLGGVMYWTGFNQVGIPITRQLRKEKSTYTIGKRWNLLVNAITSFTPFPLKMLFNVGL